MQPPRCLMSFRIKIDIEPLLTNATNFECTALQPIPQAKRPMSSYSPVNVRRWTRDVIAQYRARLNLRTAVSHIEVTTAFIAWHMAGSPGAAEAPSSAKLDRSAVVIRAAAGAIENAVAHYEKTHHVTISNRALIEASVDRAPMPPVPGILLPFLPEHTRHRGTPAKVKSKPIRHEVTFSKRQTTHLRHLAQAWGMSVAEIARVLISSHPCMHLPASISPPEMIASLRGLQAQAPGGETETVVVVG